MEPPEMNVRVFGEASSCEREGVFALKLLLFTLFTMEREKK